MQAFLINIWKFYHHVRKKMFSVCVEISSKEEPCLPVHWFALPLQDNMLHREIGVYLNKFRLLLDHTNSQVEPRSLKFNKNIYGKPEVEWQDVDGSHIPPLHFNISHTSSMIACGVTVNSAIGIDVEEKQRKLKNNILAFARRYFSPYEVGLLTAISDPEFQHQEFIKLWTLKEAYVKALGRGFSAAPFKTFTIRFRTATGGHLSEHRDSEAFDVVVDSFDDPKNLTSNWQFALIELAGSHYAAVCIEGDRTTEGNGTRPMKLTVRRTIPFVEDECVSGTDAVVAIVGLT
ncbi:uncharacterized protein LOC126725025 isoform X2 [Quercus robur]|uniref:uncharacterized protein LOC126725025 isoform X2 n=1 Tax=Quercus robur TaxID=38942 RepID=UPI00216354FB|nr:uncharacterized protein LOC126725025 isoform X2 [Quercus robur]